MSTNITNVEIVAGSLRISKENAEKAWRLDHPERLELRRLQFGEDGYATFGRFDWSGEGSGHSFSDGTFAQFVALTDGSADMVFVWEGGAWYDGVLVRDGKVLQRHIKVEIVYKPGDKAPK